MVFLIKTAYNNIFHFTSCQHEAKHQMAQPKIFDISGFCTHMEQYVGPQEGPAKLFWQALSFAVSAHEGQKRKSGEAFVSHPCKVALILAGELGVRDPEILAAAALHDTVEDNAEISTEDIGEMFGQNVEEIVDGCTKISSFEGTKQEFYKIVHRKIFSGAAAHVEVMLIKLADRLHNLRTLSSMPKHKQQKIADETLDIYAPLARVMGLFGVKRELYNLALQFKFPRQSSKVKAHIQKICCNDELDNIKDSLQKLFNSVWLTPDITISCKGLWAYFNPVQRLLDKEIKNPINIIITVNSLQICYQALGLVNQKYPPIPRTIRDYIANPKSTGYQSLHAKANIRGRTYLIKFRSQEMARAGRLGVLNQWSSERRFSQGFQKDLREMFDILGADEGISYREMIAASGKKEIYTYTPKGDLYCLPVQSTVLDFAFKVHTDVGYCCTSALVNRERVKADHILNDGDQVEISVQRRPVDFSPDIQHQCQTPKARSALSRMFRLRREKLAREIGQSLLLQELKCYGIPKEVLEKKEMADLLTYFQLDDIEELYQRIGEDRLRLRELIYEISNGLYAGRTPLQPPTGAFNSLLLSNLDSASMKFSRCCNPLPTEKSLLGLLSERGLSVHRKACKKFKTLAVQREEVLELRWIAKKTMITKRQRLFVAETSRHRLMMLLAVAPNDIQVHEISSLTNRPSQQNDWDIKFQVTDLAGLKNGLQHFAKAGLHYEFVLEL